jgi:hypothetical protein
LVVVHGWVGGVNKNSGTITLQILQDMSFYQLDVNLSVHFHLIWNIWINHHSVFATDLFDTLDHLHGVFISLMAIKLIV